MPRTGRDEPESWDEGRVSARSRKRVSYPMALRPPKVSSTRVYEHHFPAPLPSRLPGLQAVGADANFPCSRTFIVAQVLLFSHRRRANSARFQERG